MILDNFEIRKSCLEKIYQARLIAFEKSLLDIFHVKLQLPKKNI